jgi:endonuclease/exonuclease/phosphatase family metal-dependent hydrolase
MRLRIATFNVENLGSRHSFGPKERPDTAPALSLFDVAEAEMRESVQRSVAVALEDDKRELSALALADLRADILALQEIDNLGVLQAFFANYVHRLADIRYGHFKLVDGNDPRGIDVAFAARLDLIEARKVRAISHHEATFGELGCHEGELERFGITPDDLVFNRDCLEVLLDFGDRQLAVYVCHFKAIADREDGRAATLPIRRAEARAVRRIVQDRFGEGWPEANWVVAGDLNDFSEQILPGGRVVAAGPSGLDDLLDGFAVNPVAALAPTERWTLFHSDCSATEPHQEHVQLDYVLLSPALAAANPNPRVEILRRGLPYRVPTDPAAPDRSIGFLSTRADRYPRTGWDRPKASDHCPLVVEIEIPRPGDRP